MSYSIDRSRAVALEQRDGVWSLELEQLVRINRNTFRPRRQRVTGAQAIVQHLLLHHSGLVNSTRQVLDSGPADAVRFELQGGGWVMTPEVEDVAAQAPAASPGGAGPEAALNPAIIQEITSLRSRVEHLERTVALLAEEIAQGPGAGGGIADELLSDLSGEAGTEPEDGSAPESAEPEAPPEPDYPPLKPPSLEAVMDLVKGLVGDEVTMGRAESGKWAFDGEKKAYLACLNGDGGEPIGALVMDLEGTIRLAGGMLMEPKDELDAQVEDGEPSEDILDAAGEVLNTLTSAVNKVSGNAHVRAGRLEELSLETHDWLAAPRTRQDFSCSIGGLVSVVGR